MNNRKILLLCVGSALLGALATVVALDPPALLSTTFAQEPASPATPLPGAPGPAFATPSVPPLGLDDLTPEERVNVAVYERGNRSAVNIATQTAQTDPFFGRNAVRSRGEGSGTILDRQGRIVTNAHVVEDATDIRVTLHDGKTYEARLVGRDPATDVAVIQIDAPAESLLPVTMGQSNGLRVGQRVFAIGNPFGFERTLTTGIISSLDRTLPAKHSSRKIKSLIQIDAAINPGNSGGPLLDSRGRMIGMNTAIASRTGESTGVGFAIPVNTIARIVPQLIQHGRVLRPDLGIATVFQTSKGLLIRSLTPGGPAEKAGLQGPRWVTRRKQQGPVIYEYRTLDRTAADLIVAVDGRKIADADSLLEYVDAKKPGDRITLSVLRNGQTVDVPLTLEAEKD